MKPWQQQHIQTSPTHLCAGPPIGTYSTLENLTLSAHPPIADGEAVAALPLQLGNFKGQLLLALKLDTMTCNMGVSRCTVSIKGHY